jgi:hypothetical protein
MPRALMTAAPHASMSDRGEATIGATVLLEYGMGRGSERVLSAISGSV